MELLLRYRTHRIGRSADIQNAFLQTKVRVEDKDAFSFWPFSTSMGQNDEELEECPNTRLPFRASSSRFFYSPTFQHHLNGVTAKRKQTVHRIRFSFYVYYFLTGVDSQDGTLRLNYGSNDILAQAGMQLRKWTSN